MKEVKEFIKRSLVSKNFQRNLEKNNSLSIHFPNFHASSLVSNCVWELINERSLIVIAKENSIAEELFLESKLYNHEAFFLPGNTAPVYSFWNTPHPILVDRIKTLSSILSQKKMLVFTSVRGFLQTIPLKKELQDKSINLKVEDSIPFENLILKLSRMGYKRKSLCEDFGTFSVKGSIIDIYSSNESPIRIDFFGDQIESIRYFDPETQKSFTQLIEISIFPATEYQLTTDELEKYNQIVSSIDDNSIKKNSELHEVLEELIPQIRNVHSGLLTYFEKKPVLLYLNNNEISAFTEKFLSEVELIYQTSENSIYPEPNKLYSYGEEMNLLKKGEGINLNQLPPSSLDSIYLKIEEIPSYRGKLSEAKKELEEKFQNNKNFRIFLVSNYLNQLERLKHIFNQFSPILVRESKKTHHINNQDSNFFLINSYLKKGFKIEEIATEFWTENEIFGKTYSRKNKFKSTTSQILESFSDLKEGDCVVHINHGIGKFLKIERISSAGKEKDFLKLLFSDGDHLFVPLDQISLVQKYIGNPNPRLDSLSKSSWKKTKEKAKESIHLLANDLIQIYANRMKMQGYAFPKDSIWQEEFEALFEYEETPDQLSAIEAVKKDLESSRPMDRLICGDVGFGKTEVAIRAAFKVILAGKQVMMLAPTTILALQHFKTFQKRFKDYPIRTQLVSRLESKTENLNTIKEFNLGQIDLLIGTHSILSNSIKPKNLGLLIIDEEQKFGVNQKEELKKIKNLVHVLTLSATPIPRTLHMSLTGIRDLSIITTPPKERLSVETYVIEENEKIIRDAVYKEIERGGQVFYLYNNVEQLPFEERILSNMFKDLRIGTLHGQLAEDEIEEVLIKFNNREFDILLTTTIIESGIDMPNVNTLIVKNSHNFGLSQLYQIRGRVGRSERQAYAYFLYSKNKIISEKAEKRLNTIFENQDLGSGFKVALRDLEIRGAGHLLGTRQSGEIMDIGFELYSKMLNEAIAEIKGKKIESELRTVINLHTNFYIPNDYILDTKQKIEIYKKLEGAESLEDIFQIKEEMLDRFGPLPPTVEIFIQIEDIRILASMLRIESISEHNNEIRLKTNTEFKADVKKIVQLLSTGKNLFMDPNSPKILILKNYNKNERNKLEFLLDFLKEISNP